MEHLRYWRLDGHRPVPVADIDEMVPEFGRREDGIVDGEDPWRVARTALFDGVYVSTVFLGINHAWDDGPPLLFETMVFGLPNDHYLSDWQERCSTWEQAERQHESIVEMVTEYVRGEMERLR